MLGPRKALGHAGKWNALPLLPSYDVRVAELSRIQWQIDVLLEAGVPDLGLKALANWTSIKMLARYSSKK
jgi:hypothetical protein